MLKRLIDNISPSAAAAPPPTPAPAPASKNTQTKKSQPVKVTYESQDVDIPADFLVSDPADAQPIMISPVDWKLTPVPEYAGRYAVVLDNVLSPSECETLLRLAEQSVTPAALGPGGSPWSPAMVNVGAGFEVLVSDYRNSDRIIWDQQEVIDRLWTRCLRAPGLEEQMAVVDNPLVTGGRRYGSEETKDPLMLFKRVNNRMRFLKYGGGQFFRPHCDASYIENVDGKRYESLFTLHLYLNDSQGAVGPKAELVGGSTPFLSRDEKRRVDVHPKAGRVLIFQHRGLLHSGDDVVKGTKYTVRTDIMYERVYEPKPGKT